MNGTMYETENGIIYKASMNASKYVEELIQKAIEDGKLVQVVRCGECKRSSKNDLGYLQCKQGLDTILIREPSDYCSYGERRGK